MENISPFTSGPDNAVIKLNQIIRELSKLQDFSGDGIIEVKRIAAGYTIGLNINRLLPRIPTVGGSGGARNRRAFCKTAAGAATTIVCYLNTDATGTEVTVNCNIAGGGNLDGALPRLTDGLEITVWNDAGTWKCTTIFQKIDSDELQVDSGALKTKLDICT